MGIRVKILAGNKNQNIPTLNENSDGSITATQVIFLPKPSCRHQIVSNDVKAEKAKMAGILNLLSKNCIKTMDPASNIVEIKNRSFFDIIQS